MIEYVKGQVADLNPAQAVLDVNGVGYDLAITLSTYSALQGVDEAKLYVHEIIRDDAHQLVGFASVAERQLFRDLISVSGVGAGMARMILSSIPPSELQGVIVGGDEKRLKAVKGIGARTAQRIIVDLRDKIKPSEDAFISQPTFHPEVFDEALAALVMLGFAKPAAQKALQKLLTEEPQLTVEAAIKRAFSMI